MNDLTQEELEERLYTASEIVRSEPPADPVEKAEWIDSLLTVADEFSAYANMRESEAIEMDWDTLSCLERLRGIATKARTAAESFSKPRHKRTLEEVFYPGGE